MKKKTVAAAFALLLVGLGAFGVHAHQQNKAYHGATETSRALLLGRALAGETGESWTIAAERKIADYIISGAYSSGNQAAVAVFKQEDDKYKLLTAGQHAADEVITDALSIDGEPYQIAWFQGVQTEYAEISYTVPGQTQDVRRHDTADMNIICEKAPAKEYTVHAAYFDSNGSKYE